MKAKQNHLGYPWILILIPEKKLIKIWLYEASFVFGKIYKILWILFYIAVTASGTKWAS